MFNITSKSVKESKSHVIGNLQKLLKCEFDDLKEFDIIPDTRMIVQTNGRLKERIRYFDVYLKRYKNVKFKTGMAKKPLISFLGKMNIPLAGMYIDPSPTGIPYIIASMCNVLILDAMVPMELKSESIRFTTYFKNITTGITNEDIHREMYGNITYCCETPEAYATALQRAIGDIYTVREYSEMHNDFYDSYESSMSLIERTSTFIRTSGLDQRYIDNALDGLHVLSMIVTNQCYMQLSICARVVGYCTFRLDSEGKIDIVSNDKVEVGDIYRPDVRSDYTPSPDNLVGITTVKSRQETFGKDVAKFNEELLKGIPERPTIFDSAERLDLPMVQTSAIDEFYDPNTGTIGKLLKPDAVLDKNITIDQLADQRMDSFGK